MVSKKVASPQKTLVILLGASEYPYYPELNSHAFENSVAGLQEYFLDIFCLPKDNLLNLFNKESSSEEILNEVGEFLEKQIKEEVTDLIVYFIGHGAEIEKNTPFLLSLRSTKKDRKDITSLPVKSLANELKKKAPNLRHIVILDICFAARALKDFQEYDGKSGSALLCSSSSSKSSEIGQKYTKFSEAILHALAEGGNKLAKDYLSLNEVNELIKGYLNEQYPNDAPKPEIYSPSQSGEDDVACIPLFPNLAYVTKNVARQKRFEPDTDKLQCFIMVSETEGKKRKGESLERTVQKMLRDHKGKIEQTLKDTDSPKLQLQIEPYCIYVSDAFSSQEAYQDIVFALCRAEIAVFDLTNYEPAIMLFLGIRSVVRRGVTVASIGGEYVLGDTQDFPFNIKEVNIISHSYKQHLSDNPDSKPRNLIGKRIDEGLKQLTQLPNYLDLPAFDAVRNLPPENKNQKTKQYTEQVLLLCSFSQKYQENNFKKHLADNLPINVRDTLDNDKEKLRLQDEQKPDIIRTLDMKTPRLVSQTLFEALRLTEMCVIDWTEWKPNVFFELGTRLSVNEIGPVCIIEDKHKAYIEELFTNQGNPEVITRPQGIDERDIKRLLGAKFQCMKLLDFLKPIKYKAPTDEEGGSEDEQALKKMVADFKEFKEKKDSIESDDLPVPYTTFNIISKEFDWKVEAAAKPVYTDLINNANLMSNPEIDTDGISPVLYPKNETLIQKAAEGALERRIAAWLYINSRYSLKDISNDKKLKDEFMNLANIVSPALIQSSKPNDNSLGKEIRVQLKALKEIIKKKTDEGHS